MIENKWTRWNTSNITWSHHELWQSMTQLIIPWPWPLISYSRRRKHTLVRQECVQCLMQAMQKLIIAQLRKIHLVCIERIRTVYAKLWKSYIYSLSNPFCKNATVLSVRFLNFFKAIRFIPILHKSRDKFWNQTKVVIGNSLGRFCSFIIYKCAFWLIEPHLHKNIVAPSIYHQNLRWSI